MRSLAFAKVIDRVCNQSGKKEKDGRAAQTAIGTGWTLGVLARHAGSLGKDHGAGICRKVAEQLHG